MGEEIQGLDPGLLKLRKIQGLDPGLLMTVNTNSGKLGNKIRPVRLYIYMYVFRQ
jgi:hypothetical protein